MAARYTLAFRFVSGRAGGGGLEKKPGRIDNFVRAVITDVGFETSDRRYNQIRGELIRSVNTAVTKELRYMASFLGRNLIGRPNASQHARGTLYPQAFLPEGIRFDVRGQLSTITPPWMPRTPAYLASKRRSHGHIRWFEQDGGLGRALVDPNNWLAAYGPITVSFRRAAKGRAGGLTEIGRSSRAEFPADAVRRTGASYRRLGSDRRVRAENIIRVRVGTLRVGVFGYITPAMLPALATGRLDGTSGNAEGLHALSAAGFGAENAAKLLGSSHRYRHVVEPFLAWYLTRAVPVAVLSRVQNYTNPRNR